MMSERLYYADSYLRTFEAQVIERLDIDGHAAIILDRSAFYPEGGGQPSDRGMLNQTHVIDVSNATAMVQYCTSSPSRSRPIGWWARSTGRAALT